MYLRITQRHNRDGSTVSYYALAESVWNAEAKRREARVVHGFGRADQLDRAELERLVKSINRVLDDDNDGAGSAATSDRLEIEIERVFALGVVLADRATRDRAVRHGRQPPRRSGFQAGLRRTLAARHRLASRRRRTGSRSMLSCARLPGGLGRGDRTRGVPQDGRPVPPRCRSDLL